MEVLALAVVGELARQESFDVLRVRGEDDAIRYACVQFGGLRREAEVGGCACGADRLAPEFNVLVASARFDRRDDKVDGCASVLESINPRQGQEKGGRTIWKPEGNQRRSCSQTGNFSRDLGFAKQTGYEEDTCQP